MQFPGRLARISTEICRLSVSGDTAGARALAVLIDSFDDALERDLFKAAVASAAG